jgi:type I restriction enzyme S subunit
VEVKPGYKQTEVGVIPEEWKLQCLGRVAAITTGRKDVNEGNPAGEYPFFTCSKYPTYSDNYSFDTEAILIAGNGDVGNLHYYYGKFEAYQRTYVLSRFSSDVRYVWHQLNYRLIESLGLGKIGTSIPYIKKENLTDFAFPVPPTEAEQRAIATALSDVDALLGGLDRLIAKKRDLKQAAMQQLLTGQTRLPGFHGEWETLPARDIGVFKGGSGFPLATQGETGGEYPFFKVSDMNNEGNETFMTTANHYISEQTRKRLGATAFPADSIVFAKVGAAVFLERKRILGQASCIDNNMAAFVLDKSRADVGYVHSLLLSKKLGALVATTALPALNAKQLGEMPLVVPPLSEQTAIAAVLSDIDAELVALEARRNKSRALKQAMMPELLTGKTRLVSAGGAHA